MKLLIMTAAASTLALATPALPPALYQITTETGMPHLEENLRYSTTHEKRCVAGNESLATAFPVLQHASLKDCHLELEKVAAGEASYQLMCEGGHGTTGQATWELGAQRMIGTLHVKLGGKNMTFYQRITAVPVGQCSAR